MVRREARLAAPGRPRASAVSESRCRSARGPSCSSCQATVSSRVSSCGRGSKPSSLDGLVVAVGPPLHRRAHLVGRGRRRQPRARQHLDAREQRLAGQLQRRRRHAGDAAQVREQPLQGEVAAGEQVALALLALLVGQQVPAGDVADVDDVEPPVDVGGNRAAAAAGAPAGSRSRWGRRGPSTKVGLTTTTAGPWPRPASPPPRRRAWR